MKKVLLSIFTAAAIVFTASAQDDMSSIMKQEGGERQLEVQFAPLGGSPISIGGIRYRAFLTDRSAYRATIFIGYNSTTSPNVVQNSQGTDVELEDKESSFIISLRPGYEMHFDGTDRLSPYVGAEIDFAMQTSSSETQSLDVNDATITNTTKGQDGFTRFGLNLVAGVDYYVAKNLYLGTELGFGFAMTSNSDIKFESDAPGFTAPDPTPQGSSLDLGPNVLGQIRLGYTFK